MIEASISSTDPTKNMDRHQPPKNAKASWGKNFGGGGRETQVFVVSFEMNCSPLKALGISLDLGLDVSGEVSVS